MKKKENSLKLIFQKDSLNRRDLLSIADWAMQNENTKVLENLFETASFTSVPDIVDDILISAIENSNITVVDYISLKFAHLSKNPNFSDAAAKRCQLEILKKF